MDLPSSTRRPCRIHRLVAPITFAFASLALSGTAGAQGISYTLTPSVSYADWDNDFGLEESYFYGGRLSFDFGRFVSLEGFYLTSPNVRTELGRLALRDTLGNPLPEQDIDMQRYGANVIVRFGTGTVRPLIKGGGSILRLDPEEGNVTRLVGLNYGAGLRFGRIGQTNVELSVAAWQYQLNRFRLAPTSADIAPTALDPERDETRTSFAVSGGIHLPFGGEPMLTGEPPRFDWRQTAFPVELFAGELQFDSDETLEDQSVAGARLGVDLAPRVGARGFYWRGVNSKFDETDPIQSWGGEAQFSLNEGRGLAPFLIIGAGRIDFKDDYRDQTDAPRDDKTYLLAGGGIVLPLTETLRLTAAARDHIFSAGDLEDVSTSDQLRHSWMFSGGLSFVIGTAQARRERLARERAAREETERERMLSERERQLTEREAEIGRRRLTADTVIVVERELVSDSVRLRREGPVVRERLQQPPGRKELSPRVPEPAPQEYAGERTVNIPVPREGELYVRYGPGEEVDAPGAMRAGMAPRAPEERMSAMREMLRDIVREELDRDLMMQLLMGREAPARGAPPAAAPGAAAAEARIIERVTAALQSQRQAEMDSLRAMISRLAARQPVAEPVEAEQIEAIVTEAVRAELDRQAREGRLAPERITVDTAGEVQVERERQAPSFQPRSWSGYTGFGFDASQMLLGVRTDLGPPFLRYPDVRLVPEVTVGFLGGSTTAMLAGNLHYIFPQFRFGGSWNVTPYAGLGLGLLNVGGDPIHGREGTEAVLNVSVGTRIPLGAFGNFGFRPSDVFLEYQGVDLSSLNRLLLGLQAAF